MYPVVTFSKYIFISIVISNLFVYISIAHIFRKLHYTYYHLKLVNNYSQEHKSDESRIWKIYQQTSVIYATNYYQDDACNLAVLSIFFSVRRVRNILKFVALSSQLKTVYRHLLT